MGILVWWHIFFLGVLLLFIEATVIPGFGVVGILGLIAVFFSFFVAAIDPTIGLLSVGITVTATFLVLFIIIKFGARRGLWRRFVLREQLGKEEGYVAAENPIDLVGKQGVAVTPLRPAGTAMIEDQRIDVVSVGTFIEKDRQVRVEAVQGSRIVVREIGIE